MNRKNILKPDDLVVMRDDVVSRFLDDRAIIICPESRHPFRLNEVGTRIWKLMDRHRRVGDLVDAVHGSYQVDRNEAFPDIIAFLTELMERNLIKTP